MGSYDEGLQSEFYCVVMDSKVRVEDVADEVGISPATMREWMSRDNKKNIPAKILRAWYARTGDARLKKFLEPPGWELVPVTSTDLADTLEWTFGSLHLAGAELHRAYRDARDPNSPGGRSVTPQEAAKLEALADRMESHARQIREWLKSRRDGLDR